MLIEFVSSTFSVLPAPLGISAIYGLLAAFFLIFPIYGAWEMRRFKEREAGLSAAEASAERLHDYRKTMLLSWSATALIGVLFLKGELSATELWLIPRFDTLSLVATAVALLGGLAVALQVRGYRTNEELRAKTRPDLAHVEAILPRSHRELRWFYGMSVTAGITEEILYRGFLLAVLTPALGLWGAMIVSCAAFGFAHIYQGGLVGFARTALIGAVLMAVVYFAGSIWPAVILHAVLDIVGGYIGYHCLKDGSGSVAPPTAEHAPSAA